MEEYQHISEIDKIPISKKQLSNYRQHQVSRILMNIDLFFQEHKNPTIKCKYIGKIEINFLSYAMHKLSEYFKLKHMFYLVKFKKPLSSKLFSFFNLVDKVFVKIYLSIPPQSSYRQQIYREIINKQNNRLTRFVYTRLTPTLNNIDIYHNYKLALKDKGYHIQRTHDKKGNSCILITLHI